MTGLPFDQRDAGDEQEEAPKTPVYCKACGAELAHEFDLCPTCDAGDGS